MSEARAVLDDVPLAGLPLIELADEAATIALGRVIAAELEPGDVVALRGEVGAGKTTLARAILRAHLGDPALEVPSPTFTLLQTYDGPRGPVHHVDLYRLAGPDQLVELGFDELRQDGVMLLEWPERAESVLGTTRLDLALELELAGSGRRLIATGAGPLFERFARTNAVLALLARAGWADAERIVMGGDASTRAYERLVKPSGKSAILMISPPRPDGPPVRRGRPYSAIARLAESVHAFVAVDRGLRSQGFSAPAIYASDLEAGLLVIEDFGREGVVDSDGPIPDRYAEATRLLARLHGLDLPAELPIGGDRVHAVPPYDLDALLIEVDLLLDWYQPHIVGSEPSGSVRAEFGHIWRETLAPVVAQPTTWTLRDYHSPNLIWLPDREGTDRVGLLDFQDAVLGHPAFDVASLLQDARVTVPAELELKLLGLYAAARRQADPTFDTGGFAAAYAILAAQRATKILGIFARLDKRDGKPDYLRHLPRIQAYLARNLAHPALARLKGWYAAFGGFAGPSA
ncbi:MAG: tRNA (adenosine(37)-N6)-threonylcarbamoyltransferase complex ATPase subunit type 1 TsaE [Methylobacteriaceae bacterium]|nr:tRNA (adenosine(37)-N6)-threonylcarbamoyltransferase complex ATPase subunit type 1 TsaE [Methylobacteriaceae bacterium]